MVKSKILSKYSNLLHFFGDKNSSLNWENIVTVEQIHSNKVAIIKDSKAKFIKGYDGIATNKPLLLGIRTADCLPIFFYEWQKKIIAGAHAGWKGLSKGIIEKSMAGIKKIGGKPQNVIAAIGPHIRSCCYEVDSKRVKIFAKNIKNTSQIAEYREEKWFLNLEQIALTQMEKSGILKKNIEILPFCTCCNEDFFSFRRESKKTGRLINIIGLT